MIICQENFKIIIAKWILGSVQCSVTVKWNWKKRRLSFAFNTFILGKGYWKDIILGRKDGGAARWNIFIEFNELESLASTRINEDAAKKDVLPMLFVVCLLSRMKLKRMCTSHFFPWRNFINNQHGRGRTVPENKNHLLF